MKNTTILIIFVAISTLAFVGCGQTTKSPVDTVEKVDAETLQKQAVFDQAMIEQSRNTQSKK
ncbi:MAG: hypothetical protein WC753_00540 [Candidatus Gracilibacteria bacterium]|jgi:hypothetical protein